jgi:hypothetical protein
MEIPRSMIRINNNDYVGRSISISGNKIIVDGKDISGDHRDSKAITINITGDLDSLDVDYCDKIEITGNVNKARTGSGDINCANITNGAQTGSGDIECESINGDVQTGSGDVKATTITGSVRTGSGDIKYRK